jgi:CheY-like chemotaxis protein
VASWSTGIAYKARPQGSVLVVDDDMDIRALLRLRLERMGYRVEEAASGEEALEKARAFSYDLCLLDICMPGADGIETLDRLRDVAPSTRVVFVTASTDDETFDRAVSLDTQPDGFIAKPVSTEALERCVDVVLKKNGRYLRAV